MTEIGRGARPGGALDEAFPVVRAAGIDAFAAPVGQRCRAGAAEQGREPTRQVAADHVAILAVSRPARHQLRQIAARPAKPPCSASSRFSRQRIVLTALADDDLAAALLRIGEKAFALPIELALQRLGVGRNPDGAVGPLRPERGGREIAKRLADAGAGFGEEQIGLALLPRGANGAAAAAA
jgi:hypothetical protein